MQLHDHNNIERLYLKTLATDIKTLAVLACEKDAGVTTLAMALAQRHLLAKRSVLYVELNSIRPTMSALCPFDSGALPHNPLNKDQLQNPSPDKNDAFLNENFDAEINENADMKVNTTTDNCGIDERLSSTNNSDIRQKNHLNEPMLIQPKDQQAVITGILAPSDRNDILALRNTTTLREHIDNIAKDFDAVIIDCAPLCGAMGDDSSASVPADIVASVCDASILIVQGGVTKAPILKRALNLLASHDKKPTAIAINQQYNPTLGQELIREILRLQKYLPRLTGWLSQKVKHSLLMHPL